MILITDDGLQIYYWVNDQGVRVSPHFDYEEDAVTWRQRQDDNHEPTHQ